MAQSKLHKDIIVLAEALVALFMIGNKPFTQWQTPEPVSVCLYLLDDVPSHVACGEIMINRTCDWEKDF